MMGKNFQLTGIYTLTPMHCGTGQASGAIDLPIAREAHTQLPVLPATTLKGIARWLMGEILNDDQEKEGALRYLFGPEPPIPNREKESKTEDIKDRKIDTTLAAGNLVFLDGMLLALAVRSLTGVYRQITSPLLIQRLRRAMKAFDDTPPDEFKCPDPETDEAWLPSNEVGPVSLEDIVLTRCHPDPSVDLLAKALGALVADETSDADRLGLQKRLVVVHDTVLQDLASRATAVQARIVLDSEKKTSKNLWYEESLPDDCLFCCIIATRPEARPYERSDSRWRNLDPLSMLRKILGGDETKKAIVECTQIGGNATVGMGQCRWVLIPKWENDHGSKKE